MYEEYTKVKETIQITATLNDPEAIDAIYLDDRKEVFGALGVTEGSVKQLKWFYRTASGQLLTGVVEQAENFAAKRVKVLNLEGGDILVLAEYQSDFEAAYFILNLKENRVQTIERKFIGDIEVAEVFPF